MYTELKKQILFSLIDTLFTNQMIILEISSTPNLGILYSGKEFDISQRRWVPTEIYLKGGLLVLRLGFSLFCVCVCIFDTFFKCGYCQPRSCRSESHMWREEIALWRASGLGIRVCSQKASSVTGTSSPAREPLPLCFLAFSVLILHSDATLLKQMYNHITKGWINE